MDYTGEYIVFFVLDNQISIIWMNTNVILHHHKKITSIEAIHILR